MKMTMVLMTILWITLTAMITFVSCVYVASGFKPVVLMILLALVGVGVLLNVAAHAKFHRKYKIIKKE